MKEKSQTVVFLVRHGQTDKAYSTDPAIDGQRRLTEEGRVQIERVGEYLAEFAPGAIYSSPMERTKQSAEIIRRTALVKTEVRVEPELHEIYNDTAYLSVGARVGRFLAEAIARHAGEQLVCVSHQDVIEALLGSLGTTAEEADTPCLVGDCYRLVFAGAVFVECLKVPVAHALHR